MTTAAVVRTKDHVLPIEYGYDGVQGFGAELFDIHGIYEGNLLHLFWSVRNRSGRDVSGLSARILVCRGDKCQPVISSMDWWLKGRPLTSEASKEISSVLVDLTGITRISITLLFIEFADGQRVGDEYVLSAHRADIVEGYHRLFGQQEAGVPEEKLLDSLKPELSTSLSRPDDLGLREESAQITYEYFKFLAGTYSMSEILEKGRQVLSDPRAVGIYARKAKLENEIVDCKAPVPAVY